MSKVFSLTQIQSIATSITQYIASLNSSNTIKIIYDSNGNQTGTQQLGIYGLTVTMISNTIENIFKLTSMIVHVCAKIFCVFVNITGLCSLIKLKSIISSLENISNVKL